MSAGHHHEDFAGVNAQVLDKYAKSPELRELYWRFPHVDHEHDLPYLGGYSGNGKTIYIDRHFPQWLEGELDGVKKNMNVWRYVQLHEDWEWAVMEAFRLGYGRAHAVATAAERRAVLADLGPGWWPVYSKAIEPFIKADDHEKLTKVPADLDMRPYTAPPVEKALIRRLQDAMGKPRQFTKEQVNYTDTRGGPDRRCGPVQNWPRAGVCGHYEVPAQCTIVKGYIAARGGCDKWESIDQELREHGLKQVSEQAPASPQHQDYPVMLSRS